MSPPAQGLLGGCSEQALSGHLSGSDLRRCLVEQCLIKSQTITYRPREKIEEIVQAVQSGKMTVKEAAAQTTEIAEAGDDGWRVTGELMRRCNYPDVD
ncbi:hypothetical protein [Streptomyces syringium]|uniref:hypothetical protein n=1 Tax=Streptomyces syringium TaxID=76729 RepID=UPI0034536D49